LFFCYNFLITKNQNKMFKRPILTIFFASLTFVTTLVIGILSNDHLQVSLFNKPITAVSGLYMDSVSRIDPEAYGGSTMDDSTVLGKYGEWSFCQYEQPETPEYNVEFVQVQTEEGVQPGDVFSVSMTLKNTGNTRLFAQDVYCFGQPVVNLGTQKEQDRMSIFGGADSAVSGWAGANRITMSEDYVDPEGEFHINFQSVAPAGDNIYREYFQPVVEGVAWVGEPFGVDISVGSPTEDMKSDISFVTTVSMDAAQLSGLERNVEIVLADQMLYAKFGDTTVWSMQISSGAWATPTPRGTYQVLTKQELRIGVKYPHYRMPAFQLFDWRGYGLHALPYLNNDGGTFWSEALSHIGIPVSHGCVRMLPDDATTLYEFTSIGTPIVIR
jgi:L,D-transpeptidase catalytic domain